MDTATLTSASTDALSCLRALTANPSSQFRPGQLEAIEALVERRARVLVVQRTGWGKSAVYFVATALLRSAGMGPTLLVSPLLALMRNQLLAAERLGIRAETINSTNPDRHHDIVDRLADDDIDLLLVSPERLANPEFLANWGPVIARRPGLLVVDEVHCISDWGHDFRPDYRRIAGVLDRLPSSVPVLGCTATANDRVVDDVARQLGSELEVVRGPLGRDGLCLQVIDLPSRAERLAWLTTYLPQLPGSGIIYCLTIDDTRKVAEHLQGQGLDVVAYSGADDNAVREAAEDDLLANRVKALAATSALGMGFDKPDLGFVVHFQAPGSPVAYYQQVGRAGRQLEASVGVLLRGHEDTDIQNWFINTAFPDPEHTDAVLQALDASDRPLSVANLEAQVNLRRSRLEILLKQLEVDGAVQRVKGGWVRTFTAWRYPTARVAAVTAVRRAEQEQMLDYAASPPCRMQFLRELLDDRDPTPCGLCDICAAPLYREPIDVAAIAGATNDLRHGVYPIEPRRMWPTGLGEPSGRISPAAQLSPGRTLAPLGDDVWGAVVRRDLAAGCVSDELVEALAGVVRTWRPDSPPVWVTAVPSARHPELVRGLGEGLALALGLPYVDAIEMVGHPEPQQTLENSAQKVRNVYGAFRVAGDVSADPVLLVDDIVDSRWTFTVVGQLLHAAGSGPVLPVALAHAGAS